MGSLMLIGPHSLVAGFIAAGSFFFGPSAYFTVQNLRHPSAQKTFERTWRDFFDILRDKYKLNPPRRAQKRFDWFKKLLNKDFRLAELKQQGLLPHSFCELEVAGTEAFPLLSTGPNPNTK
jgi:hypothetical protein